MVRARLHRMASGHIVAVFKTDDVVDYTRVVGSSKDQIVPTAHWVKANFKVDQVAIRNSSGDTIWIILN